MMGRVNGRWRGKQSEEKEKGYVQSCTGNDFYEYQTLISGYPVWNNNDACAYRTMTIHDAFPVMRMMEYQLGKKNNISLHFHPLSFHCLTNRNLVDLCKIFCEIG